MNKVLAVALLDFRRFGFGVLAGALIAGLTPALASGLGTKVPLEAMLAVALGLTGVAAGGYFGNDFADGRGSFFFARPLPVGALIAGRLASVLGLAAAAFAAFMASSWLSRNELSDWSLDILGRSHFEVLAITWSVALYAALAIAAAGRNRQHEWKWRDALTIPVRLIVILGGTLAIFGLFADLMQRAYGSPGPLKLMFGSWVVAAAIASVVAIAAGRTEGMRIARFQHLVVFSHLAIVAVVVVTAWIYLLNPGPAAIQGVLRVTSSPDGSTAWATTTVDRGDATHYRPIFSVDLTSGQVAHLKSDPDQGPWPSADGKTIVWSAATPIFFRPFVALFGEASTFRVRGTAGKVEIQRLPARLGPGFRGRGLADFLSDIYSVLPSADGEVLAVLGQRLSLVSRSGEDRGVVDFGKSEARIQGMAFAPSGALQVALGRPQSTPPSIEFVEVDPHTLKVTTLGAFGMAQARVQFNRSGTLVLVHVSGDRFKNLAISPSTGDRFMSFAISLVNLEARPVPAPKLLLPNGPPPRTAFLADGRIVAIAGGRDESVLRVFTPSGEPTLELPLGEGIAMLSGEMFPGIVAVHTGKFVPMDLALIDCATGAVVRRVADMNSPLITHQYAPRPPAPLPGTPGARLLTSGSKLYELPSLTDEPRLLLPIPQS